MPGDVQLVSDQGAVQALVKEQIGARLELAPWSECSRQAIVLLGLKFVVDVRARAAPAVFAIGGEGCLQLFEQIGRGAKVTVVWSPLAAASFICSRISRRFQRWNASPSM